MFQVITLCLPGRAHSTIRNEATQVALSFSVSFTEYACCFVCSYGGARLLWHRCFNEWYALSNYHRWRTLLVFLSLSLLVLLTIARQRGWHLSLHPGVWRRANSDQLNVVSKRQLDCGQREPYVILLAAASLYCFILQ